MNCMAAAVAAASVGSSTMRAIATSAATCINAPWLLASLLSFCSCKFRQACSDQPDNLSECLPVRGHAVQQCMSMQCFSAANTFVCSHFASCIAQWQPPCVEDISNRPECAALHQEWRQDQGNRLCYTAKAGNCVMPRTCWQSSVAEMQYKSQPILNDLVQSGDEKGALQ